MMRMDSVERLICPAEISSLLLRVGGENRFGGPNFRLIWGQTETYRAGGAWAGEGQPTFRGYRDLLVGFNEPHWILQEWQPPEKYISPANWYAQNLDQATGLQILGEFPYRGRYETVLPLVRRKMVNSRLVSEMIPLSPLVLEIAVMTIKLSQEISLLKRKAIMETKREREKQAEIQNIADRLDDARPRFGEIRSSSYLNCQSEIQRRCAIIERNMARAAKLLKSRPKGLSMVQ